ncbi:MAG: ATP-dependent DNA ligase [Chitinophagaceae bacterium]|nr:ATP-dependent DNA ligase [Chitinophagaceae bacterium]
MHAFAKLVNIVGTSTKTNEKLQALVDYFSIANDTDKLWVIAIFSGRRPKRIISSTILQKWCAELTGIPQWLFEESYHTVGDLAETITLLFPDKNNFQTANRSLSYYLEEFIRLEKESEEKIRNFIFTSWNELNSNEKFVFNKLITGSFRIGVSQQTIVNALAKTVNISPSIIAHRISGNWHPVTTSFDKLLSHNEEEADASKPYPFYLSYAIEKDLNVITSSEEWQAEWKWDGIRGQIIKRHNEIFVWSRGEELMTEKFPEYLPLQNLLPNGVVIDGEIICLRPDENIIHPLPFSALQTRIGRKNITKKQLLEAPVSFIAYDIIEHDGTDIRNSSLAERRQILESIISAANHPALKISPIIEYASLKELEEIRSRSREINSEGIMLKRKNSTYQVGRMTRPKISLQVI